MSKIKHQVSLGSQHIRPAPILFPLEAGPQVQGSGLRTRSRIRKDIPQGKHGLKSRPELRIVNNRRLLMCRGKSAQYSDQQTRYREPDQRLCVKNKASSLLGEPTYHRVRHPPSLSPLEGAASESARIWPPYLQPYKEVYPTG